MKKNLKNHNVGKKLNKTLQKEPFHFQNKKINIQNQSISNNNTTQMTSNRGTFNNKISPYEESLKFKNKNWNFGY